MLNTESARPEKRGFYGGLAMMTAVLGGVIAQWVVSLFNTIFTTQQMRDFGWRIPFLSSFIVAILGIISQRHMQQSFEFLHASQHGHMVNKNPMKDAIKYHWRKIILIMFAVVPWCAGGYITFTFLPVYLQSQLNVKHALLVSSFLLLSEMICLPFAGILADKYNYFIVMKLGAFIMCIWSFPAYYIMNYVYVENERNDVYWPLILAGFITAVGGGLFGGPMQIFMVNGIEDVVVRYSAIGIAYNACQAIFGGTAPLLGSALSLKSFILVGVYLAIFCAISTVILYFMSKDDKDKGNKSKDFVLSDAS